MGHVDEVELESDFAIFWILNFIYA